MDKQIVAMCGVTDEFYQHPQQFTIDADEYNQLLKDSMMMDALRQAGVDNWCGWDDALDIYQQWVGEEE